MTSPLKLTPGQKYTVIKPFTDFDQTIHPIGESWIFSTTNFLPYEDGLTLHVIQEGLDVVYRLKWTNEDQGPIIDNFPDFIRPC